MPDPGPDRPPAPIPPPAAAPPPREVQLTLAARHALAPGVLEIRLHPPPGVTLGWQAGQYLDLMPADGRPRSFSIANPPAGPAVASFVPGPGGVVAAGEIVLHVRLGSESSYSRVLATLPLGRPLKARVARGDFQVPPEGLGPTLWLAGGTGLAPLMAMLATVLPRRDDGTPRYLYWGVREEADLYAAPTLDAWTTRYPAFAWTPVLSAPADTWRGARGLVHEALLDRHGDLRGWSVYASGPPAMIAVARDLLPVAGLPPARLHYDRFEPALSTSG